LLSVDEHSLQSPFAYEVYTKFLKRGAGLSEENGAIENLRSQLRTSGEEIELQSDGAPSSLSKRRAKKVSEIAKHGISNYQTSRVLSNLISFNQSSSVLELGTSLGLNTMYMNNIASVEGVTTIEGNPDLCALANTHFRRQNCHNITLKNCDIESALIELKEVGSRFDFIYVDANHTYEATLAYYRHLMKIVSDDGILVFDDINWSVGMKNAWEMIKTQMKFGLTIENNELGIVFLRQTGVKANYIARF
jgi:predicted O-methyltransferase YrrM